MTELGKGGKHMGVQHPRVARRIDPEPPRSTPKAKPKRKHAKPYGYSYVWVWKYWKTGNEKPNFRWFKTERQRDQAMASDLRKYSSRDFLHILGPVTRDSPLTPRDE